MAATDSYPVDHVAAVCHVSPRTLTAWRKNGEGPPWAKFGQVVIYPCAEFDAWFQAQIRRPGQRDQPAAQPEASVQ